MTGFDSSDCSSLGERSHFLASLCVSTFLFLLLLYVKKKILWFYIFLLYFCFVCFPESKSFSLSAGKIGGEGMLRI